MIKLRKDANGNRKKRQVGNDSAKGKNDSRRIIKDLFDRRDEALGITFVPSSLHSSSGRRVLWNVDEGIAYNLDHAAKEKREADYYYYFF